jgi:hypothetical protein
MKIFLLVLFGITSFLNAVPKERVFTGSLSYSKLKKEQLIRIYLLNSIRPSKDGKNTPQSAYSAIVTMHLAPIESSEYVGLFYEEVKFNPQTQEFWLFSDSKKESENRLPTLRLKANKNTLEGDYSSPGYANLGTIKVQEGYDVPSFVKSENLLTALSGMYTGSCQVVDEDKLVPDDPPLFGVGPDNKRDLVTFNISGSKFKFEHLMGTDEALNTINYIGNGSCDVGGITKKNGDYLNCAYFEEGNYNFYKNEIRLLTENKENWTCERLSPTELNCNTAYYKNCKLTRAKKFESMPRQNPLLPSVLEVNPKFHKVVLNKTCGSWDGEYFGSVTHKGTGKLQWFKLVLESHLLEGPQPPVKCAMSGTFDLIFGTDIESSERITVSYPVTEFVPVLNELILIPDKDSDLILQIEKTNSKEISGIVYSKLFGQLGSFEGFTEPTSLKIDSSKVIPNIAGDYDWSILRNSYLSLKSSAVAPEPKSKNPFKQIQVSGWHWVVSRMFLEGISYDYFTNHIILKIPGSFRIAKITPEGIDELALLGKAMMGKSRLSLATFKRR